MSILVSFFFPLFFLHVWFFYIFHDQLDFLCVLLSRLCFPEEGTIGVKKYESYRLNKKSVDIDSGHT